MTPEGKGGGVWRHALWWELVLFSYKSIDRLSSDCLVSSLLNVLWGSIVGSLRGNMVLEFVKIVFV